MLLRNFRYCTNDVKLLRTSIYRFADRVSKNSNSIVIACTTPIVHIHSLIRQWWSSVLY